MELLVRRCFKYDAPQPARFTLGWRAGNNPPTRIVESSMLRLTLVALTLAQGLLPAQSPGKITGKITDAVTRQPIPKVHVGCNVGAEFVGVLSGPDGSYTLENVPAGDVRMTINLPGYKLINDNQDPDAGFRMAAGDTITRNFAMHPLGRVYGRLTDRDSGEPIEGHTVSAGRREYVPGYVYYMGTPGPPGPNRGEYDLPGLEAGDYRISVESPDEPVVVFKADAGPAKPGGDKVYGHRWYPDVARPEMAAMVHLGDGESLRLDISIESHEAHTLSGTVVAPRGFEHEPVSFALRGAGPGPPDPKKMASPGPFRIENLAPGTYELALTAGKPPHELAAYYDVEVADHDIENFKATLAPEASIAGEIRMLEEDAKPPDGVGFSLVPTSGWVARVGKRGTLVSGPRPGIGIRVKGTRFQMDSIPPGQYWPQVTLPEGYAVAQMRFEGASARNNAMTLSGPDAPITIVVTSRPGLVGGMVRSDDQTPVRGATVALLPDPLPDEISPATIQYAESGDGGAFVFKDVAPGAYRAVVLNGDEDVHGSDAGLRERAAKAEALEVRPAQSASVSLKR
jgi:hypothetical protein